MIRYITDDLELSSDDFGKEGSDKKIKKGLVEYRKSHHKIRKNRTASQIKTD